MRRRPIPYPSWIFLINRVDFTWKMQYNQICNHVLTENSSEVCRMSIGERITELRKKADLSQGQLASLLEVSRQAVSKWENDTSSPDTLRLIRLADVLNTDVEYLATGKVSQKKVERIYVNVPVPEVHEKIVEKPVVKYVEKPVIQTVERVVEKPVIKKVIRVRYLRNPVEYAICGSICLAIGILLGIVCF